MKKLLFSLAAIGMLAIGCGENDDVISQENGSFESPELPTPPNPQNPADEIIMFEDPIVKQICVSLWDTNGDNQLSKAEAAAVKSIGLSFSNQPSMRAFTELKYFTGLTKIESGAFACKIYDHTEDLGPGYSPLKYYNYGNLSKIAIPKNVTSISEILSDFEDASTTKCRISIYFTSITPPYIFTPAFGIRTQHATINIYVPKGASITSYKEAINSALYRQPLYGNKASVSYYTYTPQDED